LLAAQIVPIFSPYSFSCGNFAPGLRDSLPDAKIHLSAAAASVQIKTSIKRKPSVILFILCIVNSAFAIVQKESGGILSEAMKGGKNAWQKRKIADILCGSEAK